MTNLDYSKAATKKVLVNGHQVFFLSNIKRDKFGNIRQAYVVNGHWNLEIKNNEVLAKACLGCDDHLIKEDGRVVEKFPLISLEEIDL
jgi:hypothetical protein